MQPRTAMRSTLGTSGAWELDHCGNQRLLSSNQRLGFVSRVGEQVSFFVPHFDFHLHSRRSNCRRCQSDTTRSLFHHHFAPRTSSILAIIIHNNKHAGHQQRQPHGGRHPWPNARGSSSTHVGCAGLGSIVGGSSVLCGPGTLAVSQVFGVGGGVRIDGSATALQLLSAA